MVWRQCQRHQFDEDKEEALWVRSEWTKSVLKRVVCRCEPAWPLFWQTLRWNTPRPARSPPTAGLENALPVEEPALGGCSDGASRCVRTTWTASVRPRAIRPKARIDVLHNNYCQDAVGGVCAASTLLHSGGREIVVSICDYHEATEMSGWKAPSETTSIVVRGGYA